jgi:WD40 repeat protein
MNDNNTKALLERYGPKELKQLRADRQLGVVRFTPCGKFLFAGGLDGTVRRWSAGSGELAELPPLDGHGGWVQTLAFGGRSGLYTADSWGQLRAWSVAGEKADAVWFIPNAHDGWIRSTAVNSDGAQLATCGLDQIVRVWSARDGSKQQELTGHGEDVFCVAFHPDGRSILSGDIKGVIRHWDVETGSCMRELDARVLFKLDRLQDVGGVRCLAFNRDGTMLAVGGTTPKVGGNVQGNPTILVFDWQTGMKKHSHSLGAEGDGFVYDMHFHPAGFLMAVTSGNPGSGKFLFIRPGDAEPFFVTTKMPNCHSIALHPNGIRLAVSATNGGSNGNGRQLKNGAYAGNWSPVHIWELPGG